MQGVVSGNLLNRKQEVPIQFAGIPKKWKGGDLRYSRKLGALSIHP